MINRGRKIQTLLEIDHHIFRERHLCTSASYQQAIGEAQAEMDAQPHHTIREITDAIVRGIQLEGKSHGFFWQEPERGESQGLGTYGTGGTSKFMHARRRYSKGWDAGKEPS